MTEQSKSTETMLLPEESTQLEKIISGVVNRRILSLQRIDDLTGGEVTLLRSTQSTTCSSASTGGCTIRGGGDLAVPA
jgi:hypothetical protein